MTNGVDRNQNMSQQLNKSQLKQLAESQWVAPDGGWGWMCVMATFITFGLVVGMSRTFGIIYNDVMEAFPGTKHSLLVMIPSMIVVLTVGLGIVAGPLTVAYSIRSIVFVGGLLSGIGLCLNFFAMNIYYMMFCFTISGIGAGLSTNPGIMIVAKYFRKRRAQAIGLSLAGTGVGSMFQPLLIHFLNDSLGFRGTLLIQGGIVFHVCAGALFYRDPVSQRELKQFAAIHAAEVAAAQSLANENDITSDMKFSTPKTNVCFRWVERHLYLDLSLVYEPAFILTCLSVMLLSLNYPSALFVIPPHAKKLNFSSFEANLLLTISSAGDLMGRIISGFIFDKNIMKKSQGYILATLLFSIALIIVGYTTDYYVIAAGVFFYGFFAGTSFILIPVLLSEQHGASKLASSFGIARTCMAVTCLLGPPLSGYLRDITGDFKISLLTLGLVSSLASLVLFFIYVPLLCKVCFSSCKKSENPNPTL